MRTSRPVVVYDACALYPAPLRDLLMHLALMDLFRACWSEEIQDEWIRNVLAERPDLTLEQLSRTRQLMDAHVRDSLITGYEYLITSIHLPDPSDRHVAAAAIHSGASIIVTFNLKDFPEQSLEPFNLVALHPDDFVVELLESFRSETIYAVKNHRQSLKNPARSTEEYLDTLLGLVLVKAVMKLRLWSSVI